MTTPQITFNICVFTYTFSMLVYLGFRKRVWRIIMEDQKRDDQLSPEGMYFTMMYVPIVNTAYAIMLIRDWIQWKRGKYPEY